MTEQEQHEWAVDYQRRRVALGLSVKDIAQSLGMSRTVVYRYLRCERRVPDETRARLDDALQEPEWRTFAARLEAARIRRGLSCHAQAREIGIDSTAFKRTRLGAKPHACTAQWLAAWLAANEAA